MLYVIVNLQAVASVDVEAAHRRQKCEPAEGRQFNPAVQQLLVDV